MYRFQQRLKTLKRKIKDWNRNEFGNIFEDKKILEEILQDIQVQAISHGYSIDLQKIEQETKDRLNQREQQEETFWK